MTLSEQEKTEIRRYLGYGMRGDNPYAADVLYGRNANPWTEDRFQHLTTTEETWVRDRLALLKDMEEELYAARDNFDTLEAGSFKQNTNEVKQRSQLLKRGRRELAEFLGIKQGDGRGMAY